jgi:DNA-binding transcriptional LysR family regulator
MLKSTSIEDWDNVRFFLAAARAGSLNAAAKSIGASQPTMSRRIAALEANVGAALFDRHRDGLALTDTGRAIMERALALEEAALALDRKILAQSEGIAGTVRVTATEGIGALWLTPRLRALADRHRDLQLEILLDNAPVNLLRREADIALRLSRPSKPDLIARKVGELNFSLFASRGYCAEHGEPTSLGDLARHSLVDVTLRQAAPDQAWHRILDGEPRIAFNTNSTHAQLAAVRAGYGISLLPSYVGSYFDDIVAVVPEAHWRRGELWLVAHTDLRTSPRIRLVYDAIVAFCAEDPHFGRQSEFRTG